MSKAFVFTLKLLVSEYYKRNAGLLFLVFLLSFAIIPPQYLIATHYALILAQISSPVISAIVSILWIIYAARAVRFIRQTLLNYWDTVSSLYPIMGSYRLRLYVSISFVLVFLPVLGYALLMAYISFQQSAFIYTGYLLSTQLFLIFVSFRSIYQLFISSPIYLKITWNPFSKIKWHDTRFILQTLLIRFYWKEKKGALFLLKVISYVSFHVIIQRNSDFFREDYFAIFLLLIGFFHSLLIFMGHKHLEEKALFLRNLPFSIRVRAGAILLTALLIYLPELCFLVGMSHPSITIESRLVCYLMMVSQFLVLFSLLYSENFRFWKFIKYTFIIFFGYQLMIALLPIWVVIILNLPLGLLILYESYPKYEYQSSFMKKA